MNQDHVWKSFYYYVIALRIFFSPKVSDRPEKTCFSWLVSNNANR